ncbi:MAG: hypothetical protein IPK82_17895 [Polyangiaceae bacterium]|nr:hypothetical protein [Polyangiaceae bacterium]
MASQRLNGWNDASLPENETAAQWRAVVAHDGRLPTCDRLLEVIGEAMEGAQIIDAPSTESARFVLRRAAVDVCFVCLDLPPAPQGGIKFAQELVRAGCPVVLVTRSLRWLPKSASELKVLPWVAPESSAGEVLLAVQQAVGENDLDNQVTLDPEAGEDALEELPIGNIS